jgi:hypothetical protein
VLDPGGLFAGGGIGLTLLADGLDAQHERAKAAGLAHHAVGSVGEVLVERGFRVVLTGAAETFLRVGGGEVDFLGVGGELE